MHTDPLSSFSNLFNTIIIIIIVIILSVGAASLVIILIYRKRKRSKTKRERLKKLEAVKKELERREGKSEKRKGD